jgi:antitoxin ParD1/3/4
MSNNTSFSLGDHFNAFIETQVARGRFASASDMVRAGLHLMEEQEAKQDALRSALIAGEESGYSTSFDFDQFIAGKRAAATEVE